MNEIFRNNGFKGWCRIQAHKQDEIRGAKQCFKLFDDLDEQKQHFQHLLSNPDS